MIGRLALALTLMVPTLATAQDDTAPISGYAFMESATQQLQDDDFLNPAFFLIDRGLGLWTQSWPGAGGQSCQSCHGDPQTSMQGVAARYPAPDPATGGVLNLELKINREIVEKLGGEALAYESDDLLALTVLIGYQSRGLPMDIDPDPRLQDWIDRGEDIFLTKRGQLNLSCKDCHQDHAGDKLRGDTISQGHINAFPIFRLTWDEVGSRHRMFTWCMDSIRAEPYDLGSDAYLALELYLTRRGQGLPIETPGVRR